MEEIGDLIVDGQEPLRLRSRLETLHDPFSSPCRPMRILGPVVQAFVLAMLNLKAHLRPRRAVGFKLVGDHDPRRSARAFQKFRQETRRGAAISPLLDQNFESEAAPIDRPPKPVRLAGDGHNDFVQMPFVPARRGPSADRTGERPAELIAHRRTVSQLTHMPRAARISSTMRRLKGKRNRARPNS